MMKIPLSAMSRMWTGNTLKLSGSERNRRALLEGERVVADERAPCLIRNSAAFRPGPGELAPA